MSSDEDSDTAADNLARVDWNPEDLMLRRISLRRLNRKGYINLERTKKDKAFGFGSDRSLKAARWRAAKDVARGLTQYVDEPLGPDIKKLHSFHRIHPIFRWHNWDCDALYDRTNGRFHALEPVLQLATLLLEDHSTVAYISSMLDISSHKRITWGETEERLGRKVYCFEKRQDVSDAERVMVWKELQSLSENIWWNDFRVKPGENWIHASTQYISSEEPIEMHINAEYLDVLCGDDSPIQNAIPWMPGSDRESAYLRSQWMLAMTLVHEVMHALWFYKHQNRPEPFQLDVRTAELGFLWENLMFSGNVDNAVATEPDAGCPYILVVQDYPGPIDQGSDVAIMSAKRWGGDSFVERYAIDMDFIHGFFTDQFWSRVDRFGSECFTPQKKLGIRVHQSGEGYWPGEPKFVVGPEKDKPERPDNSNANGVIDLP